MTRRSGQKGQIVKKGDWWHVRFYVDTAEGRTRTSRAIGRCRGKDKLTESEARRKGAELIERLGVNREDHLRRALDDLYTFRQKAEWCRHNHPAWIDGRPGPINTMNSHLNKHILPFFGDLPLEMVTERKVQEFITHLKQTTFERRNKKGELIKCYRLKRKSIANIVGVVKLILGKKIWSTWELNLGKPERPAQRYFTEQQMEAIIMLAEGKWRVFFSVLAGTGIRIGECCALEIPDLDLENGVISIRRSFSETASQMLPPKTENSIRDIDIDEGLVQVLRNHIGGRTTGLVFPSENGQPLRAGNIIKRILNPILTKLGIPLGGRVNHAFRHGRVTVLRKKGIPSDLQKLWIGHSSLRTTDRYSHTDQELEYRRRHAAMVGLKLQ